MTRYYYDDVLEATWMAREFGFKFYNCVDESDINNPATFEKEFKRCCIDLVHNEIKYFVHPDSCYFLQPQAGDYVEVDRFYWERQKTREDLEPFFIPCRVFGCKTTLSISYPGHTYETWDVEKNEKPLIPFKMIQRNGKAFFMPKVEA